MSDKRPRVRIRFKYNKDTGEIEEFIIDDQAPAASEAYHDDIAEAIAGRLARDPEVEDAGPVRLSQVEPAVDLSIEEDDEGQTEPVEETAEA